MLLYVNDELCIETNHIQCIVFNGDEYGIDFAGGSQVSINKEQGIALCQEIKKLALKRSPE